MGYFWVRSRASSVGSICYLWNELLAISLALPRNIDWLNDTVEYSQTFDLLKIQSKSGQKLY